MIAQRKYQYKQLELHVGDRTWRERADVINIMEVNEWLEQYSPTIVIATDGSLKENLTGWAGAVWKDGKVCYEWSAAKEEDPVHFVQRVRL